MRLSSLACVAGALAVFLMASVGVAQMRADPDNDRQVVQGSRIYSERCYACHGSFLQGQPNWDTRKQDGRLPAPPHDETGHTWRHTDAQLFAIVKYGYEGLVSPDYLTDMPKFDGIMPDDEIWDVIAYIKSRWPDEIRAQQPKIDGPVLHP